MSWRDPPRTRADLDADERLAARIWRTRSGELIPVVEMTQRHLENAAPFAAEMAEIHEVDPVHDVLDVEINGCYVGPSEAEIARAARWATWARVLSNERASRAFAHSIFPHTENGL